MKFRKDGGLDMRYNSSKAGQAFLFIVGAVVAIIAAIIYFIYTYLFIILPIAIIIAQFKYFKRIKMKFKLLFSLSTLVTYTIFLSSLVYLNSSEPVSIYGSYSNGEVGSGKAKLKIFKNSKFKNIYENKKNDKESDNDLVFRCKKLINFANSNPDLPIIEFTKRDNGDYRDYSYYGFLHKKESGSYETTLEKIYDDNDKSYVFTNGNPSHDLKFFIENYMWFASFKGISFDSGSIIAIRLIILAGLIAALCTYFLYNNFKKSRNIFEDEDQEEFDSSGGSKLTEKDKKEDPMGDYLKSLR